MPFGGSKLKAPVSPLQKHSSEWKPEIRLPSGSDHVMLKSLDWNADYEVYVVAENQQGKSKPAHYSFRTSAQPTVIPGTLCRAPSRVLLPINAPNVPLTPAARLLQAPFSRGWFPSCAQLRVVLAVVHPCGRDVGVLPPGKSLPGCSPRGWWLLVWGGESLLRAGNGVPFWPFRSAAFHKADFPSCLFCPSLEE